METARLLRVGPNDTWEATAVIVPSTDPLVAGAAFEAISPPDISVEKEAGNYTIGSTTIVASGMADDVFADADDQNRPWIFAWTPIGGTETWGIVRNARYNRKTRRWTFMVLSPEMLVKEAPGVPGRTVYSVKATREETDLPGENRIETVLVVSSATQVAVGDVVVFDTPFGEYRAPLATGQITTRPSGLKQIKVPVPFPAAGLVTVDGAWQISDPQGANEATGFNITSAAEAQELFAVFPATEELVNNETSTAVIRGSKPGEGLKLDFLNASGEIVAGRGSFSVVYQLDTAGDAVSAVIGFSGPIDGSTPVASVRVQQAPLAGKSQIDIRILGRAMYGYAPAATLPYDADVLATALLNLGYGPNAAEGRPFGLFPILLGSVSVNGGGSLGTLPVEAELSDSAMEALRQIQNRARALVRFLPYMTGDVPSVDVEFIPRANVENGGAVTAFAVADVIEWEEDGAPAELTAVVVKPNHPYFAPKDYQPVGWWFEDRDGKTPETLLQAERDRRGVPSGRGVIEIEIPVMPSYGAPADAPDGALRFLGGVNDAALREHAEYYYDWFKATSRAVTGTMRGSMPDVVGRIISVSEGEGDYFFQRSVFVTTTRESQGGRETQFDGFVLDTFTAGTPMVPIAVISGAGVYADRNSDGSETIRLDAHRTHAPSGDPFTLSWAIRRRSDAVLVDSSTARTFETTLPLGTYDVTLTATGDGGSDVATATIQVVPAQYAPQTGDDENDQRAVNTEQYEVRGGGATTGHLLVYPVYPGAVKRVDARRSVGEEFEPIDWDAVPAPTVYEIWDTPSAVATDTRGDHYPFQVALNPTGLSYIEARVEFNDPALAPNIVRVSFDADSEATFISSSLTLGGGGQVVLNVKGDNDTATGTSVKVDRIVQAEGTTAPVAADYDGPGAVGSLLTNPVTDHNLVTLAEGQTVFVRVMLLGASSGAYDATTYLQQTRGGIGDDVALRSITFIDSERGVFSAPANGLLFFDNEGDEIGFNYRVAGVWDRLMSFANSTTYLDGRYVNVIGDTMTGLLTVPSFAVSSGGSTANVTIVNSKLDFAAIGTRTRETADFDKRIGSPAYASGIFGAGWTLDPSAVGGSFFEIDNVRIRGELRTHIFRYDEVHATNGYLYIAAAAELTRDYSGGGTIYLKDPTLASGDLGWVKSLNHTQGTTTSPTVVSRKVTFTSGPTRQADGTEFHYAYSVTPYSGTGTVPAGSTLVRVGSSNADRDGSIFFDSSSTFGPFMDVFDGVNTWTDFHAASKLKVRLGNLAGINAPLLGGQLTGHGLYANRLYLEAGTSWMKFDGAFSMYTPNLSVATDGAVTLGSNLTFNSASPIINAINGSTLTINASRVVFGQSSAEDVLRKALGEGDGIVIIESGGIKADYLRVNEVFAQSIYATDAVFDGSGTFNGTMYANSGTIGGLNITGTLTMQTGAALLLGNDGTITLASGTSSLVLGSNVASGSYAALPQTSASNSANQTRIAGGAVTGTNSITASWTKNGGTQPRLKISVSINGTSGSVTVNGVQRTASGTYTQNAGTSGAGTLSVAVSASAGESRGDSASVTVTAEQSATGTGKAVMSVNGLFGTYAAGQEVSMSLLTGLFVGKERVFNSTFGGTGSMIMQFQYNSGAPRIVFRAYNTYNGGSTPITGGSWSWYFSNGQFVQE